MDEMKLNLSSDLMRGLVAKIIQKQIKKKLGYGVDLEFDEVQVEMDDNGDIRLNATVRARVGRESYIKALTLFSRN